MPRPPAKVAARPRPPKAASNPRRGTSRVDIANGCIASIVRARAASRHTGRPVGRRPRQPGARVRAQSPQRRLRRRRPARRAPQRQAPQGQGAGPGRRGAHRRTPGRARPASDVHERERAVGRSAGTPFRDRRPGPAGHRARRARPAARTAQGQSRWRLGRPQRLALDQVTSPQRRVRPRPHRRRQATDEGARRRPRAQATEPQRPSGARPGGRTRRRRGRGDRARRARKLRCRAFNTVGSGQPAARRRD